ncbi:nucleoside-diphosphate sugar epimerase/dehydratase [Motiliproteus sp. SC1-56]|uniref:polysaccharide biosynthesis protein n=1 Tax=Motiliproteus sp. SC1-56 TaxID=2799565 RepID=UPI001A8CE737|nr:nucleoside-diphosphate sugar epimerase/dehydratase [Motiliproteus sp. SC1-56]
MLQALLRLNRTQKALTVAGIDTVLMMVSLWLAFSLRLGELYVPEGSQWLLFAALPLIALPIYIRLGLYRAVIRYIGHRAMMTIGYANALVALVWSLLPFYLPVFIDIDLFSPRSLPFIFWMVLCITVGGSRQVARWFVSGAFRARRGKYFLIYGAGEAGIQLAASLGHSSAVHLLGFVDDDPSLHGQQIAGLKVLGGQSLIPELRQSYENLEVLLALPSATRQERRRILDALEEVQVAVRTMPPLDDIALGRADLTQLNVVDITDLLGREEVAPDRGLLSACVTGKSVLVTGAGGSIGAELCRQILAQGPTRLLLMDHAEPALYAIEQELLKRRQQLENSSTELVPLLASVVDEAHNRQVIAAYEVTTVYHAAAYKHVPMVEHNVVAGVRNNVLGTLAMARAALAEGVAHFVLVSTDKAVRPTNTMGASKRLAEMVLQGLQAAPENRGTRFIMVRFGNVLGSSGSVIPLFKRQVASGGPVTVTHPEITRYFMTIPEAASLVLQAGSMGQGGDLFVLDMGEPVKIADLARRMIRLSGHQVAENSGDEGIEILYTGLRHGEKLYEELLIGENVTPTEHPRILRAREEGPGYADLEKLLEALVEGLERENVESVRKLLDSQVVGYKPQCGIEDLLWKAAHASPG